MQFSEFLKLIRFEHAIMFAIAVLIGEAVVLGHLPEFNLPIILSLLVPVFSEMGSFALNDYLDAESDKINKKNERPLVSGTIPKKFAFYFAWLSLILSVISAFFINYYVFAIAFVFNLLAILYNYKLKDVALFGNIYIALSMAIPFIFGNFVIVNQLRQISVIIGLLGFIIGLAREIVKTAEDMEGDILARKSKTLPVIIGRKNSLILAIILYFLFISFSYAPFLYGIKFGLAPISLVILGNLGIIYNIFMINKTIEEDDKSYKIYLKKARKVTLVSLFIGLLGYLIAVI